MTLSHIIDGGQLKHRNFDPFLKFCVNQLPASELYFNLKQSNPRFAELMKASESNIRVSKGFDLPAFLLKGMQRLLKYSPLLQQVMKYTDPSDTLQVADLDEAIKLMEVHFPCHSTCSALHRCTQQRSTSRSEPRKTQGDFLKSRCAESNRIILSVY